MWYTSKFFYINLIAILVNIGQYLLTSNIIPEYTELITFIIGGLQIISNAIAGMSLSSQTVQLKTQLKLALRK
jgi:hypothetical protein